MASCSRLRRLRRSTKNASIRSRWSSTGSSSDRILRAVLPIALKLRWRPQTVLPLSKMRMMAKEPCSLPSSRAPFQASRSKRSNRACFRSTIPLALVHHATVWARASISMLIWLFPTPAARFMRGRSRRGPILRRPIMHKPWRASPSTTNSAQRCRSATFPKKRKTSCCRDRVVKPSRSLTTTATAATPRNAPSKALCRTWSGVGEKPIPTGFARNSAAIKRPQCARRAAAIGLSQKL